MSFSLESRVTRANSTMLLAILHGSLLLFAIACSRDSAEQRVISTAVGGCALYLSWRGLRSPSWTKAAVIALVLLGLHDFLLTIKPTNSIFSKSAHAGFRLSLWLIVLHLLISSLPRVKPLQSLVFSFMICFSVWTADLVVMVLAPHARRPLFALRPQWKGKPWTHEIAGLEGSMPTYATDPFLEHRIKPNTIHKTYYPDNPHGYFEWEQPSDKLDARVWVPSDLTKYAQAIPPTERDGPYQVRLDPPAGKSARVELAYLLSLTPGEHELTVELDANSPLTGELQVRKRGISSIVASITIAVDSNRRSHALRFSVDAKQEVEAWLSAEGPRSELTIRQASCKSDSPRASRYFVLEKHNSAGFRDKERSLEPPPHTFRIACLGDSFTYGQGVRAEDRFSNRLESELNESRTKGRPRFEVLNFGVSGYCTWQERRLYERVVTRYRPNLIILMMVSNDDRSPSEERISSDDPNVAEKVDYSQSAMDLKILHIRCQSDGYKLAVFAWHDDSARMKKMIRTISEIASRRDIPFKHIQYPFDGEYYLEDYLVHPMDWHPSPVGHAEATRVMLDALREWNLLPTASTAP